MSGIFAKIKNVFAQKHDEEPAVNENNEIGKFYSEEEVQELFDELKRLQEEKQQWEEYIAEQEQEETPDVPKHYSERNGKYAVYKCVDGKVFYFETYENEDDAKKIVEALKEVDWDKNQLEFIQRKLGVRSTAMKNKPDKKTYQRKCKHYFQNNCGKYWVYNTVRGKKVYFGGYKTEEMAKKIVEELKLVDWNKRKLREIQSKVVFQMR